MPGKLRATPGNSVELRGTPWNSVETPWNSVGTPWNSVGFACFTQQLRGTPWAPWSSKRPGKLRAPKQLREHKLFQKSKLPLSPQKALSAGTHTFLNFLRKQIAQQVSQKAKYAASFSENKVRRKSCPTNVFAIFGQRRQLCIKCTLHCIKSTF